MSQYIHDEWGAEQGFPGGPVYAIAQTPDGYLWMGTEKGLVRFDGLNFRLLEHSDSTTLPIGPVLGLAVDAEGNLWVRPEGPRLLRYRDGKFQNVLLDLKAPEADVTAMCVGKYGEILLSGLAIGTVRYSKGRFVTLAPAAELPKLVISVAETADGKVWMGTKDAGLYYLSDAHVHAVARGLPDRKINFLLPTDRQGLWISTDNGVVHGNGSEFSQTGVSQALHHNQALVMARDRNSNVWVGTSNGLIRIDARGVSTFQRGDNRPTDAVTALIEVQHLQERSMRETATAMRISLAAAKGRLFHAKVALRRSSILKLVHQPRSGGEFRVMSAA